MCKEAFRIAYRAVRASGGFVRSDDDDMLRAAHKAYRNRCWALDVLHYRMLCRKHLPHTHMTAHDWMRLMSLRDERAARRA